MFTKDKRRNGFNGINTEIPTKCKGEGQTSWKVSWCSVNSHDLEVSCQEREVRCCSSLQMRKQTPKLCDHIVTGTEWFFWLITQSGAKLVQKVLGQAPGFRDLDRRERGEPLLPAGPWSSHLALAGLPPCSVLWARWCPRQGPPHIVR